VNSSCRSVKLFLGVIACWVCCRQANGQQFIKVTTDKQKPVEDAIVIYNPVGLKSFQKLALTDASGKTTITSEADIVLTISKLGFVTISDTLQLNQTKTYMLKESNVNLKDVVVTGQFEANTTQQSVQRVKIIDRKRIEQQGAVNLRDVLANELNIRLAQDGVLGTQMSMMGIGGQNVKILIDGVPVIGRMDGNIDISQLNLNNIERIEIIEGPMSVIYGTDALGGAINLITKKAASRQYSASVNTYYEQVGTYNVDAQTGLKYKNWSVQLSGGRNFFDGFSTNEAERVRWKQWKPREQYFADAAITYKWRKQSHRLFSQYFNETITNRNNAVVTPYSVTGFDDYFYTTRLNQSLYSDFYFNNKATLNLINSYGTFERIKNTYRKNLVTGAENMTPNAEDHDTSTFTLLLSRATYTTHNNSIFNSQFGYDINIETGTGRRLEGNQQQIGDYAAFYVAEIKPLSRLTLKQGIRVIYNTRFSAPIIPSFNAKYDITSNLSARASYARGFRAPSLKELGLFFVDVNHNIQGNEDLKAEQSDNILASLTYEAKYNNFSYKLDGSVFYNAMNNLISLALVDASSQLYTYVNIDQFKTQGVNAQAMLQYQNINATLGYSYIGRYNRIASSALDVAQFSYTPEYRVNVGYTYTKSNTDVNLFYKYNGALPGYFVNAQNQVEQTFIAGYGLLDATLSQPMFKRKIVFTAGVKNITNTTQITFNTATTAHSSGSGNMPIAMGRFIFTSIRIQLGKN
jgi:outer membrane receptor for ferrienterochelin and colicins